ncbi:NAD(P)/FAD-dependent oxidoreductase [Seonamhaeicola sp.]|uniref:flavin monoamine oxidase family protein n=1 Tax=Seonamhaeicola sp. TaxID=1912245 RepID=UPI002605A9B6|nr:NAD(P)/FAD-dependent oxidoreductase [Seonamhaeicola sp.]
MERKEFIKKSTAFGLSIPFIPMVLESCYKKLNSGIDSDFSGKVLIIGAGAAGLSAGFLLQKSGIDFEIIEASSLYGGRVRRHPGFADFPIDIGAEWIHTSPKVLSEIANDPKANETIETIEYNPNVYYLIDGALYPDSSSYSENKFKNTTWYGFFENYIVPDILQNIRFKKQVTEINYKTDKVAVKTNTGETFTGDKVLVTVPIKILQEGSIQFMPQLPNDKIRAINNITMVDGIKVFMEFKNRFYHDMIIVGRESEVFTKGYKIFYDAAFKKDSTRNILGLFAVDSRAAPYINLSEQEIIDTVLTELDDIFEGQASLNYTKHLIQNWSKEPFIKGAYSLHFNGFRGAIMRKVAEPLNNKIFFAGEALSKNNQAQVHGACETAFKAIEVMLKRS